MNELHLNSTVPLRDGTEIPQLGFGVFQLTDEQEFRDAVHAALDAGTRHFDTATAYNNEEMLGRVLEGSGVERGELYVTTKNWISEFGREASRKALEASLRKLRLDYVDLYLLHWPVDVTMMEAWETLIGMQAEGKVKSIGVSNFSVARFTDFFFKHTDVVPAVNQIESHPLRSQPDVQAYCESKDMAVEAYSPLARAEVLDCGTLKMLARECGKSPAQVVLRWHLQQGRIVIPKSARPERIRQNCGLYDFSLSEDQMRRIDALNTDRSVISWRPNDGKGWY